MSADLNPNHPVTGYSNQPFFHPDGPVEVHEDIETKVVNLNQDGSLSEELVFLDGINLETIEELSVNHGIVSSRREMDPLSSPRVPSSSSSCHPYLQQSQSTIFMTKLVNAGSPASSRSILSTESEIQTQILQSLNSQTADHNYSVSSQVCLPGHKKIFLTLPEGACVQIQITNNNECLPSSSFTRSSLPAGFSLQNDPTSLNTIEPKSQVSFENRRPPKRSGVKNVRKVKSLGSLGQVLQGLPKDPKLKSVQVCPLCNFEASTKNPYRHLQDHLARVHFKERLARELPSGKPYLCPFASCGGKQFPDWQAVMRHYIGNKHGVLQKYVKEWLVCPTP